MVEVESGGMKWTMDGYLIKNLDVGKKAVKSDWDMIFTIDGAEGGGKSVLGLQLCKYLDPKFDIDNIAFSPDDIAKKILTAEKYTAILYDESYSGLNARAAMSGVNKKIVEMMAEIRQKNLFIVIIQPCFFELDKYIALWRSRALLHVYTGENMERGRFAFFNYHKKKELWILGKKTYSYSKPSANFIGSFVNFYPVDEQEYRRVKYESLARREKEKKTMKEYSDSRFKAPLLAVVCYLKYILHYSEQRISKIAKRDQKTINNWLKEADAYSGKEIQDKDIISTYQGHNSLINEPMVIKESPNTIAKPKHKPTPDDDEYYTDEEEDDDEDEEYNSYIKEERDGKDSSKSNKT